LLKQVIQQVAKREKTSIFLYFLTIFSFAELLYALVNRIKNRQGTPEEKQVKFTLIKCQPKAKESSCKSKQA